MKNMKLIWFLILILSFQLLTGQQGSIQIKVTDGNGIPIEGARLEIMGLPGEVILTDNEGKGNLNAESEALLEVSYLDMLKMIPVSGSIMEVSLDHTDRTLQLGFGIEKEAGRNTSSIDIVYFDDIRKSSLHNPEESLYGQLSGLTVLQNGGEPWNRRPDMFIRGRGTFNNSSMLVLVDGFERDFSSLAREEIESISVLKDGAALAMYGQRGANGALLVNTRKGEYNTFHVDVSLDKGMNMPFRTPKFLNAYDYVRAVNEASALDGNPFVYSTWDLQDYQNGNQPNLFPDVDWLGETFGSNGTTTNFNTSFRGGGNSVKYFVTLNYLNETGLFKNTTLDERYDSQMKYDRFNFRTNLDIDLTKTTRFLINVAGNIEGQKEPGARVSDIMDALYSVPSAAFPVESVNGVWGGTEYYNNNPIALVSSTGLRQPHSRALSADGRIIQDLGDWAEGLSAELALAYDNQVGYWENKLRGFLYESVTLSRNAEGAITDTIASRFGSDTDLTATDNFGGQRRHATVYGKLNYSKSWGISDLNTSIMFHQDKRVNDGQYNTFLHQNMVGLASYGYKDRYYVDGVLSYSGSSILPAGNRFGFFPSLSAAWLVSRESFLSGNKTIDFLKVRASWGLSGNDIMSPNLYDQGYFSGGGYFFTNNNNSFGGIREGQLPTMGLSYEKASKFNVGAELEMIGRLQFVFDAFYELRSNILASAGGSVPSLIGVSVPLNNMGEVENKGIETSLMWRDRIGVLSYHIGGNFAFTRNRIVEMNEDYQPYDYLRQTGKPVGQQFGLETDGFFRDEDDILNSPRHLFSEVRPGDIKYLDQNGDDVIDLLDIVPIGYASGYPEIYYASDIGFEVKGFGIEALFQGIANQTIFLNTKSVFWPLRGQTTISEFSTDRWTPETAETATLPRLSLLENANNYQKNDIWLTSKDYLKLRRLEIYYNFPERLLAKLNMKSARLFARGHNLFSIDMINVLDPEEIRVTYPTLSSYHLGINLGF